VESCSTRRSLPRRVEARASQPRDESAPRRSRAGRRAINALLAGLDPHYRYSHDLVDSARTIQDVSVPGRAQPQLRPGAFTGQRPSLPFALPAALANVTSSSSHLSAVSTQSSLFTISIIAGPHAPAYRSTAFYFPPQRPDEFPSPTSCLPRSRRVVRDTTDAFGSDADHGPRNL